MTTFTRAGILRGALIGLLCVAYPVMSFIGARLPQPNPAGAAVAFAPTLLMLTWLAWQSPRRSVLLALIALLLALLWHQRALLLRHYDLAYLTEHAGMMALLAWVFGRTLLDGQTPLVTRFAMLTHDSISPIIIRYTRSVTWAWTLFFGLMASSSVLLFVATPLSIWAIFANIASPLLVLGMFVGEYLVRLRKVPADERAGPIQAFRSYLLYSRGRKTQFHEAPGVTLPPVVAKRS